MRELPRELPGQMRNMYNGGIKLGTDENLRSQISWKLIKNRQTAPLWNGKQFTREMENAYEQMWLNYIENKT